MKAPEAEMFAAYLASQIADTPLMTESPLGGEFGVRPFLLVSTRAVFLLLTLSTAGCASTITAVGNLPISSDHLDEFSRDGDRRDLNKLKTLSGDRRLIRVQFTDEHDAMRAFQKDHTYNSKWIICAETQADAITGRAGQSALTINSQGSGTDGYAETLTVTNVRSQISDVVRQLGWQVCNAFMNGALTKAEYREHLEELRKSAFQALKPDDKEGGTGKVRAEAGATNTATVRANPAAPAPAPDKKCKPEAGKTCPAT